MVLKTRSKARMSISYLNRTQMKNQKKLSTQSSMMRLKRQLEMPLPSKLWKKLLKRRRQEHNWSKIWTLWKTSLLHGETKWSTWTTISTWGRLQISSENKHSWHLTTLFSYWWVWWTLKLKWVDHKKKLTGYEGPWHIFHTRMTSKWRSLTAIM